MGIYAERTYSGIVRNRKTRVERSFYISTWGDEKSIEKELAGAYANGDVHQFLKEYFIEYDLKGWIKPQPPKKVDLDEFDLDSCLD